MVETITPVVHGGSRRGWATALALHVVGAALSAAALGVALGGAGLLLGAPWGPWGTALVVAIAVPYVAREAFGLPVPVLDARRQVPQWWREEFGPGATGFLYGLGLGVGFATHLSHGTLVAVAAVVVAGGDPVAGAATFAAFGVARSMAVGVTWTAGDPDSAWRLGRALERAAIGPIPRLANGVALAGVAAAAIWTGRSTPVGTVGWAPALLLAGAFGWAAASKTLRPAAWRAAVVAHDLPGPAAAVTLAGVPLAEACVTFLVLAGSIHIGATVALALLFAFSAALGRLRSRLGERVPCGCFGSTRSLSVRLLLARNLALGVVAAAALAGPDRVRGIALPTAADALPAALAAGGALLVVIMSRRALTLFRDARPLVER